ncbi:MMPL family transporter [Rhodoblastus sp.]|uniref:hopanoid transporter HpnN n=1 Tax=Rhodoblastus sp. TaxID=1962975 RepID=UPI003F968238
MLKPVPPFVQPRIEQIGFVAGVVSFCARRKWAVLAAALAVVVLAGFYAVDHFAISTDLNKLISADLPWRQREIALGQAFPQRDNMILAVLDAPDPELANKAALELQQALAPQKNFFADARCLEASDFFRREGLLFLPAKDVESRMDQLIEAQPFLGALAQDPSLRGLAGTLGLMARGGAEEMAGPLTALAGAMERASADQPSDFSWSALFSGAPAALQEKRRFLQVKPVLDFSALEPGADASEALRITARKIGLTPENGYSLRLTGDVALQDEEFSTLSEGAALHNSVMGLAVLFILWRALRWGRLILAVAVNMLTGLVLTAAVGLFLVRALNPISIAFAILFVGIGVDFGIQFAVRYREERFHDDDLVRALDAAGEKASLPLALAAAATAAGFYAFMPTDYRGVSELGLIAGTGMILAFFTSITLLPALLALFGAPAETAPVGYAFLAPVDRFQTRHRRAIIIAAIGLAVAGAPLLAKLRFDFNPMNLRSARVESVATLLDLMQDPRTSPNIIEMLEPSLAAADSLAARLKTLPEVESVTSLSDFVPGDQAPKLAAIHEARSLLAPSLPPAKLPRETTDAEDVQSLAATGASLTEAARGKPALARIGAAMTLLAQAPEAARLRARNILIVPMRALLADTLLALQAKPVALADLPVDLRSDWLAADGRARIEVAPRGDKNDNDNLRRFTDAVRKIAPEASGAPVSILESGDTVVRAFIQAGIMALVSISLLLYLALRRVGDVALTLAPLLLAGVYTMEICVLIDLPLNFANIIALPLLLGLGVAFKIYYVMAWRAGSAELLQTSLTRAIFFSAMTTATAFGSLWSSNHPGTSSMGKLLALSLATTLCAAVFFQPALMGPPRKPEA